MTFRNFLTWTLPPMLLALVVFAYWPREAPPAAPEPTPAPPAPNPESHDGPHLQAYARWFREHRDTCPDCGGPPDHGMCLDAFTRLQEALRADKDWKPTPALPAPVTDPVREVPGAGSAAKPQWQRNARGDWYWWDGAKHVGPYREADPVRKRTKLFQRR